MVIGTSYDRQPPFDNDVDEDRCDPWDAAVGSGRGGREPGSSDVPDAGQGCTPTIIDIAVALLEQLRATARLDAAATELGEQIRDSAERQGFEVTDALVDEHGLTLVTREASTGRVLGTLFATRADSARPWSLNFQVDIDVAGTHLRRTPEDAV